MAHSKSAKKRVNTAERNRLRNQSVKSKLKTMFKKFETAIEANEVETATTALTVAYSELDKAVSKGIVKKNTASRKKSRLAARLNKLVAA